MKTPNGADLLKTLINLYAVQEGVTITCKIVDKDGHAQAFQTTNAPKEYLNPS